MSKLTDKLNELYGEETVEIDSEELERQLRLASEASTVVDDRREKSVSDLELEAILREAEGYVIEPEGAEAKRAPEPEFEPEHEPEFEPGIAEQSETAKRIIEEKAVDRVVRKRKKSVIICAIAAAVLALALAGILLLKNSAEKREYKDAYKQAQIYYCDGKYDEALDELRSALAIEKTDECLLLMSQCYEAKHDYVNAIAILESSNSGSKEFRERIKQLKKDREEYESGKVVLICGEQYDVSTTVLDLSNQGIRSGRLDDIARLTELTNLNLSGNEIDSLDFIKPLTKLVSLDLSDNDISDISPLSNLTELRTLHLDDNKIKDFTPLYELKNLTMLTICDIDVTVNQIKELKQALPGCLIYSDEANVDIVSIRLGGKTFNSDVTELNLSDCGITDISQLSVCSELTKLNLSGNYISDISPLLDIPKLKSLDISNNSVSDISPLMSMTTLETLNLAGNDISSITALSGLKELRELNLSGNVINNTESIKKLGSLRVLGLENTGLEDADLDNLCKLKNLQKLTLDGNTELTEAAVIKLEKQLSGCSITYPEFKKTVELGGKEFDVDAVTVDAAGLGISDISAAAGFECIKNLDLSGNVISSVQPLSKLKSLEVLQLEDNNIADATPLYSLTNLKHLSIGQNGLSDEQIDELCEALPDCTITVE